MLPSHNKKVSLATGRHHGAITDGEHVWAVGFGGDGCLGIGSTADSDQVFRPHLTNAHASRNQHVRRKAAPVFFSVIGAEHLRR